jgi:multidrug efflux pump subunit AcrB
MNRLTDGSRRLLQAGVAAAVLAAAGLAVYSALRPGEKGRGRPDKVWPQIRAEAVYAGAAAQEVENAILLPVEAQLQGTPDIVAVESVARDDGGATTTLYFRPGTDLGETLKEVERRVSLATPVFPDVVKANGVSVRKGPPLAGLWLILYAPDRARDSAFLDDFARRKLVGDLEQLPGVTDAKAGPGPAPGPQVVLDPERLAARGLTADDVAGALRKVREAEKEARLGDEPAQRLREIVLREAPGRPAVRLRDVATVLRMGDGGGRRDRWRGLPAAAVALTGDDPDALLLAVRERLPQLRKTLPDGAALEVLPGPQVQDAEALLVEGRLPAGVSQARVHETADRAADALGRLPGPEEKPPVVAVLDLPAGDPAAFRFFVALAPPGDRGQSRDEIAAAVLRALTDIKGLTARVDPPAGRAFPPQLRASVVVAVRGQEVEGAHRAADEALTRLAKDPAFAGVWPEYRGPTPQLFVNVDRQAVKKLGLTMTEVMDTLQVYAAGLTVEGGAGRDVRVVLRTGPQQKAEDLKRLKVRTADGQMVPLADVVAVHELTGMTSVRRLDGERCLLITADPAPGTKPEAARRRCREILDQLRRDLKLPDHLKTECPEPDLRGRPGD